MSDATARSEGPCEFAARHVPRHESGCGTARSKRSSAPFATGSTATRRRFCASVAATWRRPTTRCACCIRPSAGWLERAASDSGLPSSRPDTCAAGGAPADAPVQAAAAVEMLHTFALIHDDVMDRSATRRGAPTVQHRMAAELRSSDGADWFGMSAAILAGDLAFVWADQMFDDVDEHLPAMYRHAARSRFDQLRTEVIAGQYLDLRISADPAATERDALRVALLKSARYTVSRPLQIGAALAGADDGLCRTARALRRRRRPRVPTPRRHSRTVREHGGHRQTASRRSPGGQAHGADGACTRPRPADRSRRARGHARLFDHRRSVRRTVPRHRGRFGRAGLGRSDDRHSSRAAVQLAAAFDEPTRTQLTMLAQYAARRDR